MEHVRGGIKRPDHLNATELGRNGQNAHGMGNHADKDHKLGVEETMPYLATLERSDQDSRSQRGKTSRSASRPQPAHDLRPVGGYSHPDSSKTRSPVPQHPSIQDCHPRPKQPCGGTLGPCPPRSDIWSLERQPRSFQAQDGAGGFEPPKPPKIPIPMNCSRIQQRGEEAPSFERPRSPRSLPKGSTSCKSRHGVTIQDSRYLGTWQQGEQTQAGNRAEPGENVPGYGEGNGGAAQLEAKLPAISSPHRVWSATQVSQAGTAAQRPTPSPNSADGDPDVVLNSKQSISLMRTEDFGADEVVEYVKVSSGMLFKCRACGVACRQLSKLNKHLSSELHLTQVECICQSLTREHGLVKCSVCQSYTLRKWHAWLHHTTGPMHHRSMMMRQPPAKKGESGVLVGKDDTAMHLAGKIVADGTKKWGNAKEEEPNAAELKRRDWLPRNFSASEDFVLEAMLGGLATAASSAAAEAGTSSGSASAQDPVPPLSFQDFKEVKLDDLTCCPISLEVMTDPVMDCDGNTYERTSIEQWFRMKGAAISPLTMKPLSSAKLVPNPVLQNMLAQRALLAGPRDDLPWGQY